MLLASVADVRAELTLDDLPDLDRAIFGALKSATHVLQRRLRTDFDYGVWEDTFMVDPNRPGSRPQVQLTSHLVTPQRARVGTGLFANAPLYETQFHLNHGFVGSTLKADFTVVSATTMFNFDDADLVADLRTFEGDGKDHTFVSTEDGRLYVQQVDVRGLFIRVGYIAGFTVASDNVFEGVPSWLEQAAILHAQIMLDKNPVIRRPEGAESMIEVLTRELNYIIDEKTRYHPSAVSALNSN